MDLSFSDEQQLLRDSVAGFLKGFTPGSPGAGEEPRALWNRFAEMGWLALPLPEDHGGFGQGAVEAGLITEAFGRKLVREPYVSTLILCGGLIARLGDAAQQAELLPRLAAGEVQVALAHGEAKARYRLSHVETTARREPDGGWRLNGHKPIVVDGGAADLFLVSVRIAGRADGEDGIGLFVVPAIKQGLRVDRFASVDGTVAAALVLNGVQADHRDLLGGGGDAFRLSRPLPTRRSPRGAPSLSA